MMEIIYILSVGVVTLLYALVKTELDTKSDELCAGKLYLRGKNHFVSPGIQNQTAYKPWLLHISAM